MRTNEFYVSIKSKTATNEEIVASSNNIFASSVPELEEKIKSSLLPTNHTLEMAWISNIVVESDQTDEKYVYTIFGKIPTTDSIKTWAVDTNEAPVKIKANTREQAETYLKQSLGISDCVLRDITLEPKNDTDAGFYFYFFSKDFFITNDKNEHEHTKDKKPISSAVWLRELDHTKATEIAKDLTGSDDLQLKSIVVTHNPSEIKGSGKFLFAVSNQSQDSNESWNNAFTIEKILTRNADEAIDFYKKNAPDWVNGAYISSVKEVK